ncbi:hypothetical protein QX220_06230 [Vibrio vulnificus]|uniref:hypothetical protein n=1 Tax=Vibrio vulnificus TaxID=672 RepID=UPI002879F2AC|nr:hypothetical protein [Vibrio vulnificus]MDS1861237.1 hypothetical protein [Vibrio vulnificus]
MATVESENKGWNEQDLDELFSTIDVNKIRKPFDEYLNSLNAFFTHYKVESNTSLLRHFDSFSSESLDDKDSNFVAESLRIANFDLNSLNGEQVILFNEPVVVSELYCSRVPYDEGTNAIRLISYKGFEKKVVTRKTNVINNETGASSTAYQIHDMALGLILPRVAIFHSVKLATYRGLLQDPNKLEATQKALQKAQELPSIEIQNIIKKLADINMIIRSSAEKINSVQANIHLLEQERLHNENTISNTQKALTKVQKDHDKISLAYQKISSELSEKEEQIKDIERNIEDSQKLLDKEDQKLQTIKEELRQNSDDLANTKKLLAEAKKEQNATSFDTAGHTAETKTQLKAYYWFAAITFLGLACMAVYVYWNGQNFSDTIYLYHVSAWDILLSRLPLVTATTLIIGGLSGVFFYLIKHIVSLNTEKMTMLKAGILAEQITNSLDCKDMTEEQILEFKRDTKIKLILQVFSKQETDKDTNNLIIEVLKAANSK